MNRWSEFLSDTSPEVVRYKKEQEEMKKEYSTRDSGSREEFSTGAMRDTQNGKARWDLLPVKELKRVAELYARGAEKYGENNYQRGMPVSRFSSSLQRHLYSFMLNESTEEDHLAAVVFNALAMMMFQNTEHDDVTIREAAYPVSESVSDYIGQSRHDAIYGFWDGIQEEIESKCAVISGINCAICCKEIVFEAEISVEDRKVYHYHKECKSK